MAKNDSRIELGIQRKLRFEIEVDGETVSVCEGESVAAALIAVGRRIFRYSDKGKTPRGLYCGIGQCQECRITINGNLDTLACQTDVAPGMKIQTGIKKD